MFSVHGFAGRVFAGDLSQLREVAAVAAVARARRAQRRSLEPADPPTAQGGGGAGAPASRAVQQALAAYAQPGSPSPRHPLTRVHEVMTADVLTVEAELPAEKAWLRLAGRGVGQAPVLDASGAIVGLLLRADLLPVALLPAPGSPPLEWHTLLARPVAELMWTPVPAVQREADLRGVAQVLIDFGLPGLPVTDGQDALCGFISRSDILRAVVAEPPLDLWSG